MNSMASRAELELSIAKGFGMFPVGNFWFDPTDNTLCQFDGTEMLEVAQLDESVRETLMVPSDLYDWTRSIAAEAQAGDARAIDYLERIDCDQCEALGINGVFCHETGCPNERKTWVPDRGWVLYLKCRECGDKVEAGESCNCQEPLEPEPDEDEDEDDDEDDDYEGVFWSCSDSACRSQQYNEPANGKCPTCGARMDKQGDE